MKQTKKLVITLLTIFLVTTSSAPFMHRASATPIKVASIDPAEGPVGTTVRVVGEIDTLAGTYHIRWDGEKVKEEHCASGSKAVNDTFTVPASVKGNHNVTLYDVTTEKQSGPVLFTVTTSYHVSTEPTRIQEGQNTTIKVDMKGAEGEKNITLSITVTDPTTASYTAYLKITTNEDGSGSNSTIYWKDFPDANANFVGIYKIAINNTLAASNFTVGLTDKLVYGATETVYIQGSGYASNEKVTVDIKFGEESVKGYPKNVTAGNRGNVTDSWNIPADVVTGNYTVTLANATTPGTVKELADIQDFKVKGLCLVQTRNLDDEPVADVTVEAYNATTNEFLTSEKTNKTGWAKFILDIGNYSFNAFWMNVHVGSLPNQTLVGNLTRILECQLARIRITVKDEAKVPLPFIDISLTCNYTTRDEENLTKTYPLETNFTGVADACNLLTNINYTLEARRYGYLFNTTLIENLTTSLWINITCPTYTLFIHVLDSKGLPLQNVQVKIYEWSSGLIDETNTDDHGSVNFTCTFGKYRVRVYNYSSELGHTVLLNETVVNLIEDQLFFVVHCKIFNLTLSVQVTDYFGQPIPNAIVKVERKIEQEYTEIASLTTESNGTVRLPKIGGHYRISVYVLGKLCEVKSLWIDHSKNVLFKLDKYVLIGPYLLETAQLITIIIISLTIAFFLAIERKAILRKLKIGSSKEASLPRAIP